MERKIGDIEYNKSLAKSLSILSSFDIEHPNQKVQEVSERLGINFSTASRHLAALYDLRFLDRNNNGEYYLNINILKMAGVILHSSDVYRHAKHEIDKLSRETEFHCNLGFLNDNKIFHMISVVSENTVDLNTPLGVEHPLYCSSMGLLFLSQFSNEKLNYYFENTELIAFNECTEVDKKKIIKKANKAGVNNYSIIMDEYRLGKTSIAAPIYDRKGDIVASISISGKTDDFDLKNKEMYYVKLVQDTAINISSKLGYFKTKLS